MQLKKLKITKSFSFTRLAAPLLLVLAWLVLAVFAVEPAGAASDGSVKPTQLELQLGLQPDEYGVFSNLQLAQMKAVMEDPKLRSYWKKQRQIDMIKSKTHAPAIAE